MVELSIDSLVKGIFEKVPGILTGLATDDEVIDILVETQKTEEFQEIKKFMFQDGSLYDDSEQKVVDFCLAYSILSHKDAERHLEGLEVTHPIEASRLIIQIDGDYLSVCGALIHDIIERRANTAVKQAQEPLTNKRRENIEQKSFDKYTSAFEQHLKLYFEENLKEPIPEHQSRILISILSQVSKLTFTNYLDYIPNIQSPRALIIKAADRIHNVGTMESEKKTSFFSLSETPTYEHLKRFFTGNPRKAANEFPNDRRLDECYKNLNLLYQMKNVYMTLDPQEYNEAFINQYCLIFDMLKQATLAELDTLSGYISFEIGGDRKAKLDEMLETYMQTHMFGELTTKAEDPEFGEIISVSHDRLAQEVKGTETGKDDQYKRCITYRGIIQKYYDKIDDSLLPAAFTVETINEFNRRKDESHVDQMSF